MKNMNRKKNKKVSFSTKDKKLKKTIKKRMNLIQDELGTLNKVIEKLTNRKRYITPVESAARIIALQVLSSEAQALKVRYHNSLQRIRALQK